MYPPWDQTSETTTKNDLEVKRDLFPWSESPALCLFHLFSVNYRKNDPRAYLLTAGSLSSRPGCTYKPSICLEPSAKGALPQKPNPVVGKHPPLQRVTWSSKSELCLRLIFPGQDRKWCYFRAIKRKSPRETGVETEHFHGGEGVQQTRVWRCLLSCSQGNMRETTHIISGINTFGLKEISPGNKAKYWRVIHNTLDVVDIHATWCVQLQHLPQPLLDIFISARWG